MFPAANPVTSTCPSAFRRSLVLVTGSTKGNSGRSIQMYNAPSWRYSCRTPEPGSIPSLCTLVLESELNVCHRAASGPEAAPLGANTTCRGFEKRCCPASRKASSDKELGPKPKVGSNSKFATRVDRSTSWVRSCSMTTRLAAFVGRLTNEPSGAVVGKRCRSPNDAGGSKNAMRVFFNGSEGTMQTSLRTSRAPCWTFNW